MRCPGFPVLVLLLSGATPAKAVRGGAEGVKGNQLGAKEGLEIFSGGWDNKIHKIITYLLAGHEKQELVGALADVAKALSSETLKNQKLILKNTYMKGQDRGTIVKFAEAKEQAEYKGSLESAPAKLAVFDFDHTLSTQFFKPLETTPTDILPDDRVALLSEMIDYLTQKNIGVVVLTRNSGALVTDAMKERLPGKVFKVVGQEACNNYDWCVYDNPGPSSKADAIKTLFLDFWDMEWSQVLFADDDPENCDDVADKSQGKATVVRVCHELESKDECKGITDIEDIKAWADS